MPGAQAAARGPTSGAGSRTPRCGSWSVGVDRARRLRGPGDRPEGRAAGARRSSPGARSGGSPLGVVLLWSAVGLAGARHRRGVPLLRPHGPAPVLTLVVPPLFLLATPTWLARLVLGQGAGRSLDPQLARPVVAARPLQRRGHLLTHWPTVVNTSVEQRAVPLRGAHVLVVSGAPHVDAGVRAAPRAAPLAAGADDLPVRHVDRAHRPRRLADLRRGRRLLGLRHPAAGCGASRPSTDQQIAGLHHEAGRRASTCGCIITVMFFRWAARHEEADREHPARARRSTERRGPHLGRRAGELRPARRRRTPATSHP